MAEKNSIKLGGSMEGDYLLRDDGSFIIKNYNSTYPFSNFLPGIAGAWGVPIWVFYVNRAQGVMSFGIKDRDHAIAEFFPANKAYCLAPLIGFRTFLKIDRKKNYEPFRVIAGYEREEQMIINSASLEFKKTNHRLGLNFCVRYFTLPNTTVGGLVRVLTIKNISKKKMNLEILDGLPHVIPFGSSHLFLKDLARTLEAWMHSDVTDNIATFRLIVDPKDTSQTRYVEGANFNYSFYEKEGKKFFPYLVVDPETIFAQDTSYSLPVNFFDKNFKIPLKQITCGKTPCSFSHVIWSLKPGEERSLYSVFGASFKLDLIKKFITNLNADFLIEKEKENQSIIEEIKNNAFCVSRSQEFNHYLKCTYLDNVLRGGYPYKFDGKDIYYIFSRKHGDLERDYNKFKLLPSYFSEGEGNYRDINQNRRVDLFFNPFIERKNIIYFLNLIKIDGYNPLAVRGERLFFKNNDAAAFLKEFKINDKRLIPFMNAGFHLGELFKFLKEEGIVLEKREEFAQRLVEKATREPLATHGEGYWIDHWRYNLDLIDNFLYFYPDKLKELALSKEYCFWDDEHIVKERKFRYYLKDGKVYQWDSLGVAVEKRAFLEKRERFQHFLRDKKGNIYKTHLIEKVLTLILNKSASLDAHGIGIEMEADKPGWCDSLNGLPALFGSSLCETLELKRACLLLLEILKSLRQDGVKDVTLAKEVFSFFNRLSNLLKDYSSASVNNRDYLWWDKANLTKEEFRKNTFFCLEGKTKELKIERLESFLEKLIIKLNSGIAKAKDKKSGIYFTYFIYEVEKYRLKDKRVMPLKFKKIPLPLFLEGPVHILRVEKEKGIYGSLRKTELFDSRLKMYRLNASLKNQPLEIGRSRIFVPGWLENESIWLHMEYKYLLEVLKAGLYREFFQDFYNCCVCFFKPKDYGRNILENSSFIVSSVYPDQNLWGRGFVARLSGATVELLDIWITLCLGQRPFIIESDNQLSIKLSPILESRMFTSKEEKINFRGKEIALARDSFAFLLFSSVLVVYHNPKRKDTFNENCSIERIVVSKNGEKHLLHSYTIKPPLSYAIREAKIERIDVYFG
jgi:hypothetical protein